jgi:hypothetical protein
MITLSQLKVYSPQHLVEAAEYWHPGAEQWLDTYSQVHNEAQGLDWAGSSHEASMERIAIDHGIVKQNAAGLQLAAQIARREAGTLDTMARHIGHYVNSLVENHFEVLEDFTVEPDRTYAPPRPIADYIAKTQAAVVESGVLKLRVGNFEAHRSSVAGQLIQAVDNQICDDPDYNAGIWRRFMAAVGGGAIIGGITGGVTTGGIGAGPGAIVGGAGAGIADLLHEAVTGDGPKCK